MPPVGKGADGESKVGGVAGFALEMSHSQIDADGARAHDHAEEPGRGINNLADDLNDVATN